MELRNNKSAWAALATLGVTAVAAGATAIVKMRKKRREREEYNEGRSQLSAEQMMVYNEAVSHFLTINERIYELRSHRQELQPLILWLATGGQRPALDGADDELRQLAEAIEHFQTMQLPFINASLSTVSTDGLTFGDCVRGAVGGTFDGKLDEEPTGLELKDGTPISFVLKLGYYFPDSTLAPHPVKSIVLA